MENMAAPAYNNSVTGVMPMKYFALFYTVMNLAAFAAFAADKLRAERGEYRLSEELLIGLCMAGGGAGGLLGMLILRHKTRKTLFRILVPLSIALHAAALLFLGGGLR